MAASSRTPTVARADVLREGSQGSSRRVLDQGCRVEVYSERNVTMTSDELSKLDNQCREAKSLEDVRKILHSLINSMMWEEMYCEADSEAFAGVAELARLERLEAKCSTSQR